MNELPSGWVSAPIGKLCTLINGRAFKPTEWAATGVPIVRIQNLNNPEASHNHYRGEISERHQLRGGELLFAWSGTPGTSFGAHIWHGKEAALNQHIFRVDFDSSLLDKRFFRFAINERLNDLIGVAQGGVGLRHVTKGVFEGTEVAVPPRAEQTRIADQLDALLKRISTCQHRLDTIPALLKRFKKSVLDAALSGQITATWREAEGFLLEDWKQKTIREIAEVGTGSTPLRSNSSFFSESGTPWVTSAATNRAFIDTAEEQVTPAAIAAHRLKVYAPGTLLIAMYGEGKTRGQVSELRIHAAINQACAAITVDRQQANVPFIKLALWAQYEQMRALAEGGSQPNLNLAKVKGIHVRLPSAREQSEIVRRVEVLFTFADRIGARYTAAVSQLERLTPLTLAKGFRGELVQQNPQDEPASILLQHMVGKQPEKLKTTRGRPRLKKPETVEVLPVAHPDWSRLPAGAWAAQVQADEYTATAQLTAVLKAWHQPMPQDTARLATLLCLQPRLLTAALPAEHAAQWRRLVGDAATPLPAQVVTLQPAFNTPWRNAISKMRARGDLVESGAGPQGTWALGPDAARADTASWLDGRAGWVVHYLKTHGEEAVLPALATEAQEFVHARAA